MANLGISKKLRINDKESFDKLLHRITFDLRHYVETIQVSVALLVRMTENVSYCDPYFKTLNERQQCHDNLAKLHICTGHLATFVIPFYDPIAYPLHTEIYKPYGEG
jgi:hypothetical protein